MIEATNEIIPKALAEWLDKAVRIDETKILEDLASNVATEHEVDKHILNVAVKITQIESELDAKKRQLTLDHLYSQTEDKLVNNLKLSRAEIDKFVDFHPDIVALKARLGRAKAALDFFEKSARAIRQKNYSMSDIIKFRMFLAGQ